MANVTIVTSNPQKALEIKHAVAAYGITLDWREVDLPELKDLSIEKIVRDKAEKAFAVLKRPVLVDDTGIFFQGYNNFPGANSRMAFMALGFKGLFKLITPNQKAYFCSFLAYKASARTPVKVFEGRCRGHLITSLRGRRKAKMPYDNIFIPQGETKTFSQLGLAGKQRYDHRSKAARAFANYYLTTQS